jgi:hypothetical protein
MTSPNISRTHQYLQAVASLGAFENMADFYAPRRHHSGVSQSHRAARTDPPWG